LHSVSVVRAFVSTFVIKLLRKFVCNYLSCRLNSYSVAPFAFM